MVHFPGRLRLGEILVERGLATQAQVSDGLREQLSRGERLGSCLVRLGHLNEDSLLTALAEQLDLHRLDLRKLQIPGDAIDSLPREFVRRNDVVPVALENGNIQIATSDPGNERVLEDLRLLTGRDVEEVLAGTDEIRERITECYEITVEHMVGEFEASEEEAQSEDLHDIEVMASEPTVINLVNLIISTALRERASDIHIVPFEKTLELRYRIDGILSVMPPPPRHLQAALVSRIKIMAEMNIAERFLPQDGHIQIQHENRRVDIRVGTMPTIHGESVVMRLLEKDSHVQSLGDLGLDESRIATIMRLVEKPHGIFLSTGPTGCGKTTTLYSVLNEIYTTERKFVTIEDPVEYELPGVVQISVRPARSFTFASGLRAILRQDPDVVMVGEIRDIETAEIAIRAALTGHLVFSTLHTNDAPGAVTRLVDMGSEPFLISSSLQAVLAQRLVRRLCTVCKRETELEHSARMKLDALGIEVGEEPFFSASGCEACRDTGYRGRVGLFELFVLNSEMRDRILARSSSNEIRTAALEHMLTIRQDGLQKAHAGITSVDEILRAAIGDEASG